MVAISSLSKADLLRGFRFDKFLSSRFWRVLILPTTEERAKQAFNLAEFEFRSVSGGRDTGTPENAIAGAFVDNAPPSLLWDEGVSGWRVRNSEPVDKLWAGQDYGRPQVVREITIKGRVNNNNASPSTFNVEISDDGLVWNPVRQFIVDPPFQDQETKTFTL